MDEEQSSLPAYIPKVNCLGQLSAVVSSYMQSAGWRSGAHLFAMRIQHGDMGDGAFSRLATQHRNSHSACVNVWGDVQPLNMRSWHLHARALAQLEADTAKLTGCTALLQGENCILPGVFWCAQDGAN